MIPLEEIEFNNLDWQEVEPAELDNLISNYTVMGAEPISYPLTQGVILYLKAAELPAMAIEIISDYEEYITINKAIIHKKI